MEEFKENVSEPTNPEYPYHVIDPDTGIDIAFETEQERQEWIEEKQEKRREG